MNNEIRKSYEDRIASIEHEYRSLSSRIRFLAYVRVALFVAIAWLLYISMKETTPLVFLLLFYGAIGVFLFAIRFHQRLYERSSYLQALLTINQYETGKAKDIYSHGDKFIQQSAFANDLDIFGSGSLYHLINRCVTKTGIETLAAKFLSSMRSAEEIVKAQQAIRELTPRQNLCQDITATLYMNKQSINEVKTHAVAHDPGNLNEIVRLLLWIWPVFSIGATGYAFAQGQYFLLSVPLVAWPIVMIHSAIVQDSYARLYKTHHAWHAFAKVFQKWKGGKYSSNELLEIQHYCDEATLALNKLGRLSHFWSQRSNSFAYFFANTFFLFDLVCLSRYQRWHHEYASKLPRWIEAVGTIESYGSLATFAHNNPTYTFPKPDETNPVIDFVNLAHPLLEDEAVLNNITLGGKAKVYVVTGSNMAGKSTFLRAIGLNLVLAHCGAPVFAERMTFKPCRLLTSFRQTDSIQSGVSYFLAELNQLKSIIDAINDNQFSVILLDEILRGTNSDDKSHGSEELLKKLMERHSITLLATHDLRLGEMAAAFPTHVANYCFESQISDGDLKFDYKIREGIARNKNASFLMQKMGII